MEYADAISDPDLFLNLSLKWPVLDRDEMITYVNMIPEKSMSILTFLEWCCCQSQVCTSHDPNQNFSFQPWPFLFLPEEVIIILLRFILLSIILSVISKRIIT